MNNAVFVRLAEAAGDPRCNVEDRSCLERTLGNSLLQTLAVVVRHTDEDETILHLADLMDGADVRMIKGGGRLCFLQESLLRRLVAHKVGDEELQGNCPLQRNVFRLVHHPHAAAADSFADEEVRDHVADDLAVNDAEHRRTVISDPQPLQRRLRFLIFGIDVQDLFEFSRCLTQAVLLRQLLPFRHELLHSPGVHGLAGNKFKVPVHQPAIGVARLRVLGEAAGQYPLEFRRQAAFFNEERRRFFVENFVENRCVVSFERLSVRQQFIENDAEGKDVRPLIDFGPLHLLGRHIPRRADPHPHAGQPFFGIDRRCFTHRRSRFCDAEIHDFDASVAEDFDVLRFDVAVDDQVGVGILEAAADLLGIVQFFPEREGFLRVDNGPEIFPDEVFHDDVGLPVNLAEVVDDHDVLVGEFAGGPCFADETRPGFGSVKGLFEDDLDRNVAVHERVVSSVHDSHATAAEYLTKFVSPDLFHAVRRMWEEEWQRSWSRSMSAGDAESGK